jgi:hypothetical protein
MKIKKLCTISLLMSIVFMSSCNFLDTKPSDFSTPDFYYETSEQLNFALNGVYNTLGSYGLYQYTYLCQLGNEADEGFYNRSSMVEGPQVYNYTSSNINTQNFWQTCYIGIENANLLLENINKPVMDETQRNNINGQVLFLRAYYYFLLVTNFGDVPLKLESTKTPNLLKIKRTPAKEVYQQIINDLVEAEPLLGTATAIGFGGRVSKSAAQGILARVCLNMAGNPVNETSKYTDARLWAKKVIDSKEHELIPNYQQVFINYAQDAYNIKESILEVEFWGNAQDSYREIGQVGNVLGIAAPANSPFGYSTALLNATYTHFKLYKNGDLRRDWNCSPYRISGTTKVYWETTHLYNRNVGKYRREYEIVSPRTNYGTPENFPLLRYSDVLLMFAEAENEINGPTKDAYDAINYVRNRAYGNLIPGATINPLAALPVGLTKDQFRTFIQDERSRELCFEGLRKSDLLRWNIFISTMETVASEFNQTAGSSWYFGAIAFKNVAEKDVLMPIPIHETSLNNDLVQNPEW